MGQQNRLKSLADDELLSELLNVVRKHNGVTAEMLAYLAEIDDRQLFLDLGFASLFEYCVDSLGLCESTAYRHIAAARVCRSHPQVFTLVAGGELHASALSLLKKHLNTENAAELFELCRRKSARQVEVLLAGRFPRPGVRDSVRRLPTLSVESPSANRAGEPPQSRRPKPLSADRYGVHFTADGEFCELLERVRGLAGHRLPSGDLLTLMKRGLEAYEREFEKERFAIGREPRAASRAPESVPRTANPNPNPNSNGATASSVVMCRSTAGGVRRACVSSSIMFILGHRAASMKLGTCGCFVGLTISAMRSVASASCTWPRRGRESGDGVQEVLSRRWRTALAFGQRLGSPAPAARSARTPAVARRSAVGAPNRSAVGAPKAGWTC